MPAPSDDTIKSEASAPTNEYDPRNTTKGSAFWLAYASIVASISLSALDLTAISTALPTITADLHGGDKFTWVGSSYALASTAILPLSGALADIFGRKPIMLGSLVLFALGSALAGAAQSMDMLIGARTVQGIGGGAIFFLAITITADLVPLSERGRYQGIVSLAWAAASGAGPQIGGALSAKASWRWLFYLNLPVTAIAFALVFLCLHIRSPEGSVRAKLGRVDWLGNLVIIAGTTLAIIGLTFGGVRFPWSSVEVLAPLIVGLALIALCVLYEGLVPHQPAIPWEILQNRTTIGGYLTTLIHGVVMISLVYYLPVYFQASFGASPIRSGVDILPTALVIAPAALFAGFGVHILQKYRPIIIVGWVLSVAGFGTLSLLEANTPTSKWVGYQILPAIGLGMLFSTAVFAVLAPLPVERTASAIAFLSFCRAFAQTWGITIASTILQNALKRNLPEGFVAMFPDGVEIAYAAIPIVKGLEEPLRGQVREAFAQSMQEVWRVMIGISGAGLISTVLLKEVPMRKTVDVKYALEDKMSVGDEEVVVAAIDAPVLERR